MALAASRRAIDEGGPAPVIRDVVLMVGLCLMAFTATGTTLASFGLLIEPMQLELGWTGEQASRPPALFFLAGAISALPAGWLIDRLGARTVMIGAGALMTGGLIAASRGSDMPFMLLAFTAMGAGFIMVTVSNTYVVARRIRFGFGMAMGLLMFGMALGSAVVPMVFDVALKAYGWRTALTGNGIAIGLVILIAALLVAPPRSACLIGMAGEDGEAGETETLATSSRVPVLRVALIIATEFLVGIGLVAMVIHFVPMFIDRGFSSGNAVLLLSAVNLISGVGPIFIGWLADRYGAAPFVFVVVALHCMSLAMIHWLTPASPFALLTLFAIMWGTASGALNPLSSMLVRSIVPSSALGRCFGIEAFCTGAASAIGPELMGSLSDTGGGYSLGITVIMTISLVGLVPFGLFLLTVGRRGPSSRVAAYT